VKKVYVLISNSRSIIGIWDSYPSIESQVESYSSFLGKDVDIESVNWNCWVEEHDVLKGAC